MKPKPSCILCRETPSDFGHVLCLECQDRCLAPNRRCRFCPGIAIERSCYCHACHGRVLLQRGKYEMKAQQREQQKLHPHQHFRRKKQKVSGNQCRGCGNQAKKDHDLCGRCKRHGAPKLSKRQRQVLRRGIPTPKPKHRHAAMPCYASRNSIVRDIGFKDYHEYLESKLWKSIREKVLWGNKPCCVDGCQHLANQVHHSKYTRENLSGRSTEHLHPVCRDCHERAEVAPNGHKFTLDEANQRLGLSKPNLDLRKNKPRKYGPPKLAAKKRPITNEPETGRSRETGSAPDLQLS